jgi:hypothetical protein
MTSLKQAHPSFHWQSKPARLFCPARSGPPVLWKIVWQEFYAILCEQQELCPARSGPPIL